ncbi:MAG: 1-acyl-sn-glycerol-3-phosphate acyltransferase [Actinobacteria bacterium]|nr:1-acyl-sn-glycerol-3-phosphate acyltransferase [Actinomycetota bacterium]
MYRFLRKVLPPTLNPYLSVHVEGVEHVPIEAPAILAMNHLSFIDSIVVPVNTPERPVYFLGKADYFESWRTRWFFAGVGVVPVLREGGDKGKRSLDTGVSILKRGDLVGIYPEGTRSPDGRLYRGKTGPVRMALEAEVPIIPTAVIGTDKAMPTGKYLPVRHPVSVRFGEPLDFSRYYDRKEDPFVLRSATDELMYEIMMLSGQEYVDEYASKVKQGEVRVDDDPIVVPGDAPAATGPGDDRRRAG